jgi:hypothetical protein
VFSKTIPRDVAVDGRDRRRVADRRWNRFGRVTATVAGLTAVWAVSFASVARRPVLRSDEAWFLLVAARANAGAPLYRGVSFVTTPLAMWLMQLAVWLVGIQVMVERALAAACLTASVALLWAIGTRLRLSRRVRGFVAAMTLVLGAPVAHFGSVYSMVAVALSLAAVATMLHASSGRDEPRAALRAVAAAGALCGAAFATKPNTGLLACAALAVVIVHWSRHAGARPVDVVPLAVAGAGAVAVVAIVAGPFVIAGSFSTLVGDVFLAKRGSYLGTEIPGLSAGMLIPFGSAAAGLLAWWWSRGACTTAVVALLAFAAVGLLAAGPDYGAQHIAETAPLLALSLSAFGLARPAPLRSRGFVYSASVVLTLALVVFFVQYTVSANRPANASGDRVVAEPAAHFSGARTTTGRRRRTAADLAVLQRETGGTVFLGFLSGSYYYLAGSLRNPTRFDYPGQSDVGAGGEPGLIRTLSRTRARWTCLARHQGGVRQTHALIRLARYVRKHFVPVARLHACDLYRRRV